MKCQLCGWDITKHMPDYTVYQPNNGNTIELKVCGQCFILTDILKTLKELKDGRPK